MAQEYNLELDLILMESLRWLMMRQKNLAEVFLEQKEITKRVMFYLNESNATL
jgi:hypothetical protein